MLQELEDKIGYHFKDKKYLKTALTHSSYANENKKAGPSNERLEFLGDSVLGVVVADYLFKHCPNMPEGDLTKTRASLVCEKALCGFATQIGVGNHLLLSNGEKIQAEIPVLLFWQMLLKQSLRPFIWTAVWNKRALLFCVLLNLPFKRQSQNHLKIIKQCSRKLFSKTLRST